MASRSIIHTGEESSSSSAEEDSDPTAQSQECSRRGPVSVAERWSQSAAANSLLHHKLFEANTNLRTSLQKQIVLPYNKSTRGVKDLTRSLSLVQISMSETLVLLRQLNKNLRGIEEKTSAIVSGEFLADVKI